MAKPLYCWRCKLEIPMLEETEWAEVYPLLNNAIAEIKRYREKHRVSIEEARAHGYGKRALEAYFKITGFKEKNPDALWHHRLIFFGPPCAACGKPLRTPKAKHCAECGSLRISQSSYHVTRTDG